MSFIDKTNIVIKKNNNDLYYFDIDKDIVLTKINNKNEKRHGISHAVFICDILLINGAKTFCTE